MGEDGGPAQGPSHGERYACNSLFISHVTCACVRTIYLNGIGLRGEVTVVEIQATSCSFAVLKFGVQTCLGRPEEMEDLCVRVGGRGSRR